LFVRACLDRSLAYEDTLKLPACVTIEKMVERTAFLTQNRGQKWPKS